MTQYLTNESIEELPLFSVEELRQFLRNLGAKPEHERYILRAWLHGQPLDTCPHSPENYFPGKIRDAIPVLTQKLQALCRLSSKHPSQDGSSRLLVELRDGQMVESVLLPRQGVCISSQVGCAVGCAFCMTGRSGLIRQLGSAEIVAQVILARTQQTLRKVVFMGMGEPSHNLSQVLEAIQLLGTEGGFAHKQLVFSTVGDRRVFERLPQGVVKPALALSLHTTRPELREKLLPRAQRIDPAELIELAENYAQMTTYPIQYQWTLLDGINDGDDEIENIVKLLSRKRAVLNLIPYNTVADLSFKRPAWDRAEAMARTLHQRGILTKLRHSAGQDIDGGCGQLRARALKN
jgi:23S rRNA (adenine2503-C2)-methyltransferase